MMYLGRPVFLFPINWAESVSRSVDFDLRSMLVGFGAEYFATTQLHTVNAWEFSVMLNGADQIAAMESFADALSGRLQGFWLPTPLEAAGFFAAASTTQFYIVGGDMAATWENRPDKHLLLEYPGGTLRACEISAVTAVGEYERITLRAALPEPPPAGTIIRRLHYARFADDEEKAVFLAENIQRQALQCIELPLEYANAETGLQPIYLYQFSAAAPVGKSWNYTSFAMPVVSGNEMHAAWEMNHGEIRQTVDGHDNELSIEARPDAAHPFSLFFPIPPGKPLRVKILSCSYAAPDTTTLLYSGRIVKVADSGSKYTATANTVFGYLKNKLPRALIGPTCPYTLFEPNTCKAIRAQFETTIVLQTLGNTDPQTIACSLTINSDTFKQEDWFAGGIFEIGYGADYEIRSILNSSWNSGTSRIELILNYPLQHAAAGQFAQATAGCDHTLDTCKTKFYNGDNHTSFTQVPSANLTLSALNTVTSQGGKK